MRDFRDAKAMAQTLRAALAARGHKITIGESLELIAKALGAADWNTLSAAIKAAGAEKAAESPPAPPASGEAFESLAVSLGWPNWRAVLAALRSLRPPGPAPDGRSEHADPPPAPPGSAPAEPARTGGARFSADLEKTLYRSIALATERKHAYTTLEHLLLALIDDPDAAAVMEACAADREALRARAKAYVDDELQSIAMSGEAEPQPTAGFHRVVQRSVIHVQSSGRYPVTGANLLVAIFSERQSQACAFLEARGMNRYDAVNFIAHGVRKGGAAA